METKMTENIGENITRRLAEHAATLRPADVPPAVMERAKLFVADFLGIAVRAVHDAESTPSMIAAARGARRRRERWRGSHDIFDARGVFPRRLPRSSTARSGTRWTSTR